MSKASVETEIETFRQLVIESRADESVGPAAEEAVARLNKLYLKNPEAFTAEDKRFVNVLRGFLAVRMAAHNKKTSGGPFAKKAKRKGDTLEQCWRCQTPVDERFINICPTCDSKEYHWRVCPVCQACGCQRVGTVLV